MLTQRMFIIKTRVCISKCNHLHILAYIYMCVCLHGLCVCFCQRVFGRDLWTDVEVDMSRCYRVGPSWDMDMFSGISVRILDASCSESSVLDEAGLLGDFRELGRPPGTDIKWNFFGR